MKPYPATQAVQEVAEPEHEEQGEEHAEQVKDVVPRGVHDPEEHANKVQNDTTNMANRRTSSRQAWNSLDTRGMCRLRYRKCSTWARSLDSESEL